MMRGPVVLFIRADERVLPALEARLRTAYAHDAPYLRQPFRAAFTALQLLAPGTGVLRDEWTGEVVPLADVSRGSDPGAVRIEKPAPGLPAHDTMPRGVLQRGSSVPE